MMMRKLYLEGSVDVPEGDRASGRRCGEKIRARRCRDAGDRDGLTDFLRLSGSRGMGHDGRLSRHSNRERHIARVIVLDERAGGGMSLVLRPVDPNNSV